MNSLGYQTPHAFNAGQTANTDSQNPSHRGEGIPL